jgi:hypothetical protein
MKFALGWEYVHQALCDVAFNGAAADFEQG